MSVKQDDFTGAHRYNRPKFFGAAVKRKEDHRLVTGRGRYVDDLRVPGTLHAAIVRVWTSEVEGNRDVVLTGRQRAHYLARHPEMAALLKSNLIVGSAESDEYQICSLLHIANVQANGSAASQS